MKTSCFEFRTTLKKALPDKHAADRTKIAHLVNPFSPVAIIQDQQKKKKLTRKQARDKMFANLKH